MSRRSPLLDDTIGILRQHGLAHKIENGGPHFKVRFTNAFGSKCLLIVSQSPSHFSAIRKNRAVLQRLLRRPAQ
jgi:hypothetical protein